MNWKYIIIGSLLCLPLISQAQDLRCPPVDATGHGTQKIDVTLGAGPTLLYGDINHRSNMGFGIALKGDYKIYKGFYAGLEIQGGQLRAKGQNSDPTSVEWDPRRVQNRYWAGSINATFYPYRFFVNERDLFKKSRFEQLILNGLYVGVGFGGVLNNYSEIERETRYQFDNPNYDPTDPASEQYHYYDLNPPELINGEHEMRQNGVDADGNPIMEPQYLTKTRSMLLPVVNVGLAVPLNKYYSHGPGYFSVVMNTQFNFANKDNLDGYIPDVIGNNNNDMYNFTYLGIRYSF